MGEYNSDISSTLLRLLGGGKRGYIPVSALDAEQLAARRSMELRKKQAQRARKKGETPAQFKEGIADRSVARAVAKEKVLSDRQKRAEERKILRENIARRKKERWEKSRWNKDGSNPDLMVPGVGTSLRKKRKLVSTLLRKNLKEFTKVANSEDWETAEEDFWEAKRGSPALGLEAKSVEDIHDGSLRAWFIEASQEHLDISDFIELCRSLVQRVIRGTKGVDRKVEIALSLKMSRDKVTPSDTPERRNILVSGTDQGEERIASSGILTIEPDTDLDILFDTMAKGILNDIEKMKLVGSGWVVNKIVGMNIGVDTGNPLAGSKWIPLPEHVRKKRAIVNLKNRNNDCFRLSVAASALLRADSEMRLEKIPKILERKARDVNMGDIETPVEVSNSVLHKFEELNPNVVLEIYGISEGKNEVELIFHSKNRKDRSRDLVRIFYWEDESGENSHFSPIKSISALLSFQLSKDGHKFEDMCRNCHSRFPNSHSLNAHIEGSCYSNDPQECVYAEDSIHFEGNEGRSQWIPFVYILDLESKNSPPDASLPLMANTVRISEQTPSGA